MTQFPCLLPELVGPTGWDFQVPSCVHPFENSIALQNFVFQLCGWIRGQAKKEISVLFLFSEETTCGLIIFVQDKIQVAYVNVELKKLFFFAVIVPVMGGVLWRTPWFFLVKNGDVM